MLRVVGMGMVLVGFALSTIARFQLGASFAVKAQGTLLRTAYMQRFATRFMCLARG